MKTYFQTLLNNAKNVSFKIMHGDLIFVIYIYINETYKWTKSNQEDHGLFIKTLFVTSLEIHAIITTHLVHIDTH